MKLTRYLSTILFMILLTTTLGMIPTYAKSIAINDVPAADSSYELVQWVINEGYISLTLGKFLPSKYVKRSEFAAIVTKLTGNGSSLQEPKTPTFQDVTRKNQFYRQIETAKPYMTSFKLKNTKLFKPNNYLTREDAMYSIVKVLGYDSDEAVGSNENTDLSLEDVIEDAASVSTTLVKYVSVGVSNELMNLRSVGDKVYFDPKKNITRLDLAVLIYNAYQKRDYTVEENDEDSSNNPQGNAEDEDNPDAGTVEKLDEPLIYVNPHMNYDSIWITKVQPLGKLEDGKTVTIVIEAEYSLVTQDKAKFSVYFNSSDGSLWKSSKELLERAAYEVPKGTGKYRFTIPVKVKQWDETTPFYFVMRLLKDNTDLYHTQEIDLT